jgi:peroxiredoxin
MPTTKTYLFTIILSTSVLNCLSHAKVEDPVFLASEILKDNVSCFGYNGTYLKLSEPFIAYNQFSNKISRKEFLELFSSGLYLPLRLKNNDNSYKLFKMTSSMIKRYGYVYKELGTQFYTFYKMEGKLLPNYFFSDIKGNRYNAESTKGKIVVIKCWFIACVACNEEIPQLNALVNSYAKRKDVVFISLATDSKTELIRFLQKKQFNYPVVANKGEYMSESLKINTYPTHLIINKAGRISKVVDNSEDLIKALARISNIN